MRLRCFIIYLFITFSSFGCTTASKTIPVQTNKSFSSKQRLSAYKKYKADNSEKPSQADSIFTYKSVDGIDLNLYVYNSKISSQYSSNNQTALVFFHGGAWSSGSPSMFEKQAIYLSQQGIVTISVEYRLKNLHRSTPFESLSDAKSAIRWVREHATDLHIDSNKIIASGESAGGHLAVSTAIIEGNNSTTDNLNISAIPNALVLFYPALDMARWEGEEKFNINMTSISPLQQLSKPLPPTVIFQGTDDRITPYPITVSFVDKAISLKSPDVRLVPYQNQKHGFISRDCCFTSVLEQTYNFILGLGWNKK